MLILANRVLIIFFIMSCLTIIRHSYYFMQALFSSTEEQPVKYKVSTNSLIYLGICISYVLSTIFTGLTIN